MLRTDKIEICKRTREFAVKSLHDALKFLLKNKEIISEADLRDLWLNKMRENKGIFENGWYIPPASGIGVIFATSKENDRLNHKSLRKMEARDDVILNKENGIAYVYCSPVDRETGVIGDFGMTFYFGKDREIINHLMKCMEINRQIFDNIKISISFSEVYDFAADLIESAGLMNDVLSVTRPDSINVIGHTIPAIHEEWNNSEKNILRGNSWDKISDMISKKRRFISANEHLKISSPEAITIEPRIRSSANPMASYHTIATFREDGQKELLENFDGIFRLIGMHYMLGEQ